MARQVSEQTAADLEYRITKLALAPGEVLVVKVAHTLTAEIGGRIRERFETYLGARNSVLVIDNSIDLQVIDGRLLKSTPELKVM